MNGDTTLTEGYETDAHLKTWFVLKSKQLETRLWKASHLRLDLETGEETIRSHTVLLHFAGSCFKQTWR